MEFFYLIICFLLLFAIYIYAENKLLVIKSYKVRANIKGLKIVQISDIHKKRCERQICTKVKQLEPDIILLTGDTVSRTEKDFSHLDNLTAALTKICPVYACPGNHELDLPEKEYDTYRQVMKKNGVSYLENSQAVYEYNGSQIKIAGAALKSSIYKNPDGRYSDLENYTSAELENALGKKDGYTILLAHNPFCLDAYSQWGADMVFSGHVHGGAVRLPIIGGVLSPERKFFPKYSKGIYKSGKTAMVVSAGIGKLRIFNPPEIVFLETE